MPNIIEVLEQATDELSDIIKKHEPQEPMNSELAQVQELLSETLYQLKGKVS